MVKPVMGGKILDITDDAEGRRVKVLHQDGVISSYGGLKEVLVKKNEVLDRQKVLGKSSQKLYLEMENQQGPLNPNSLFQD
ncbi:peptidoglycan DD-metalloendopeptidase family protein [Syntrophomonas palmitatica]|uniref:peptidoglycan DD-metalloendopeptidase family protein n=1 Tax=Syntrophomonas palmitatica TaxID=402877 RepID=UPI0006CFB170|nr:peptidoglycan DD-metalloendopeptidase family protein [Syntrophomonas palmitatica]